MMIFKMWVVYVQGLAIWMHCYKKHTNWRVGMFSSSDHYHHYHKSIVYGNILTSWSINSACIDTMMTCYADLDRYTDILLGPFPEFKHVFEERAPIKHIENLCCPLLLLQGADDKVVPPNQAVMMYNAALEKGLPAAVIIFEGKIHYCAHITYFEPRFVSFVFTVVYVASLP